MMATDWSEEAKAKRSASAKKAAETRKSNQARKTAEITKAEARLARGWPLYHIHSRVARWALPNVSVLAMMRGARHVRWGRPALQMRLPFNPEMLRG